MNHRLDLNLLPIAVALYEERGVSRTATRLGMSQPAVSFALAKLRTVFADPLFIRAARGMRPTPRAESLALPLQEVLDRVQAEFIGSAVEVELNDDDGRWIYKVKLLAPGGAIVRLEYDARDARLLRAKGRGADAARRQR